MNPLIAKHLLTLAMGHVEVLTTRRRFHREVHGTNDPRVGETEHDIRLNNSSIAYLESVIRAPVRS